MDTLSFDHLLTRLVEHEVGTVLHLKEGHFEHLPPDRDGARGFNSPMSPAAAPRDR